MNGLVIYNEIDPFATAWLRELMRDGLIPKGEIDTRSIVDVRGSDYAGATQVHLFCGIAGWPYALRLAGWPDDKPVWTGSCPCQPLSSAGKRKGHADERHLWPAFHRLIAECRPATIFGEQVSSADGREWLAGVRADLEALGYAVGAADLCAASVGAPHIRQRLWWGASRLADSGSERHDGEPVQLRERRSQQTVLEAAGSRADGGLADAEHTERRPEHEIYGEAYGRHGLGWRSDTGGLADSNGGSESNRDLQRSGQHGLGQEDASAGERMGDADITRSQGRLIGAERGDQLSPWAASVFIPCSDGKFRRVPANEAGEPEPEVLAMAPGLSESLVRERREDRHAQEAVPDMNLFPLATNIRNRLGILRGAGNAINPVVAAVFIRAFREEIESHPHQE